MSLRKFGAGVVSLLALTGVFVLTNIIFAPKNADAASKTSISFILARIEGTKSGLLAGNSTRDKFKDWTDILGFEYEVQSPRDAVSGQASGKRTHQPIKIVKEISKSSPQLFQALITNENLKTVQIDFYNTNANGEETKYYSVKLSDAALVDFHQLAGTKVSDNNPPNPLEELTLTFRQIELSHAGGTVAQDDVFGPY